MDIYSKANKPTIFIQDACYQHRFIRSRDNSAIPERPERLRAVKLGLAASIARLEELSSVGQRDISETEKGSSEDGNDLVAALERMRLATTSNVSPVSIRHSSAVVDILNNEAVKFVHGDIEGDVYLEKLKSWARDSVQRIEQEGTEIPQELNQGDLYLCPESINAIQGALGTVCEAVDAILQEASKTDDQNTRSKHAFVAIRPPGHHCGEDTPSGFCFVNNVAVGAAHAHLRHGINRVVILDIDLHHGNGTQSIVWDINEESYRRTLESEYSSGDPKTSKPGLKIYYGSVHDILSFPCEDGKIPFVQAASVSLHGPHGQWIENVHLHPYDSEEQFWEVLYEGHYTRILTKAKEFLDSTGGSEEDALVFISCGFDASEHEHSWMSRHGRKVPTSFFYHLTRDICDLAERYAQGKVISVLEGGYSDRALVSGAMAHLCGLSPKEGVDETWWELENLIKLEKSLKKTGPRRSLTNAASKEPWLERTATVFASLEPTQYLKSLSRSALPIPPSSMTLRERGKAVSAGIMQGSIKSDGEDKKTDKRIKNAQVLSDDLKNDVNASNLDHPKKKLPRVILRVGPSPDQLTP